MLCFPSVRFWPNKKYLSPMSSGASLKKTSVKSKDGKNPSHTITHIKIFTKRYGTTTNVDLYMYQTVRFVIFFSSACSLSFLQHYRIMQLLIYERVKKLPKYQHTQNRSTDGANHQSLARTKLHCRFGSCLYFGCDEFCL